jgi:hypothetical protein
MPAKNSGSKYILVSFTLQNTPFITRTDTPRHTTTPTRLAKVMRNLGLGTECIRAKF